jgi:hypothetical protein
MVNETSLPQVAKMAADARARGGRFIEVEIEPRGICPFEKYVNLWGSVVGERIGPVAETVRVKVSTSSVIEEHRKSLLNGDSQPALRLERESTAR